MNNISLLNAEVSWFALLESVCGIRPKKELDSETDSLISSIILEEKSGQIYQLKLDATGNGNILFSVTIPFEFVIVRIPEALVEYHVCSVLNSTNNYALLTTQMNELIAPIQKIATQQIKLRIPILYGKDAIYGCSYAT